MRAFPKNSERSREGPSSDACQTSTKVGNSTKKTAVPPKIGSPAGSGIQKAYNNAVAAENERAYAAQRASLLSMRRNYTQETGVGTLRRKKASTSYEQDLLG